MSNQTKVSVILTSYNHASYLRESIDSILNQTFTDFDLIIWDDCSSDESWQIIQSYSDPRIRAFRNETNQGGGIINKVVSELETGEYIAIHHSDDAWEPQKLEKQVTMLDANPQIGAVFTWAQIIDENSLPFIDDSHFYYQIFEQPNRSRFEWLHYFFYHGNALCHPSVLIRKQCYDRCGLYRYGLVQLGDLDMWIRLCTQYEIYVLPEKLVRFRVRQDDVNSSGDRPEVHIRGEFEFLQIYPNYLSITDRQDFVQVFPEAAPLLNQDEYDIPFALATTALALMNPFGRLFGLELLFNIINDSEYAARVKRIYDFGTRDFARLTAKHDIFSVVERSKMSAQIMEFSRQLVEKEQGMQAISKELLEKENSVQTLSIQLQEKNDDLTKAKLRLAEANHQLTEITTSKVWKLALLFRQARLIVAPPNSLRSRMFRVVWNISALPLIRYNQNRRLNQDLGLLQSSPLFDRDWYLINNPDVIESQMDPARHYLLFGGVEGRNPSTHFDSGWYLDTYEDVRASGINPLVHYLRNGLKENRAIRASEATSQAPNRKSVQPRTKSLKGVVVEKTVRTAYLINQKLPLSEPRREMLRRYLYKLLPAFFNTYKRTLNDMLTAGDSRSGSRGYSGPAASIERVRLQGAQSGLALWALLLKINETTLKRLLAPPAWQVEKLERRDPSKEKTRQVIDISPSQALFDIIVFVDRVPAHFLNHCIRSVQEQSYQNWNLSICVQGGGDWSAEALAIRLENDPRIHIHESNQPEGLLESLSRLVRESDGKYILLLHPYDELKTQALHQAASEMANSESDLFYCAADLSSDPVPQNSIDLPGRPEDFIKDDFAFTQFIAWKRTYLQKLFSEPLSSPVQPLAFLSRKLKETYQPQEFKRLGSSGYLFRKIPGRTALSLIVQNGNVDLITSTLPLQVLVDGRLLGRQITGTERYIWELLKELALLRQEYNLDLKVIASLDPKEKIEGVNFLTSGHTEAIRSSQVFHKTFPASEGGTLAEMALAQAVVFTPLDLILYTNPDYFHNETNYYNYRKTMQLAVQLSDEIISISKHGKLEIETILGIPSERINPVYLGVRPEHFSRENQENKDKLALLNVPSNYFLYIGTDYPHKNLVTLLRAFKLVIEQIPTAFLVIVGAKYYAHPQPELDLLLAQLASHILHLGHVDDDVLPALYHQACALVYPSLHEGFGLPLLEAMLCGTPVIASDATSVPEVSGAEAALLVDGRNEQQIAEAMIQIWEQPELRKRLVMAGYENATKFSWKTTARQTVESYRNAIQVALATPPSQRISEKLTVLNGLQTHPPTILIVTHIRFYPPAAGNEQRLFRLVKYLKKLGYQIVMLVNPFLETTELDRRSRSTIHQYVDYYEEIGEVALDAQTLALDSPIGHEPILDKWKVTEERFCPDTVIQRARSLIAQFSPKILIAEYIWTSRMFALATPDMLKVIDTIDMFSRKQESVVKFGIQDSLAITPAEEQAFFNRSDIVIAIQDTEAEAFRKLGSSGKIVTAGIDFDVDETFEDPRIDVSAPVLLIVGSANQINVHCITEFLDQVWPVIHNRVPSCRLRIIGKVCNSLTTEDPGVELIPYVKDLDTAYREAAVVINPVYAGTGIKVKSAEALGHGKAFVCWPEGAAGLTSGTADPFIMIHSWDELADAVTNLLNSPEQRQELERAAWKFAKATLSDQVIYREVSDCFDTFSKREPKVLCLFLRYGINDHPQGLSDLQDWYRRKMTGAKVTTWIIDNKIKGDVDGIDLDTGLRLLSGENQQREFSAFQRILREHREEIETYDVIHFVTSAFNTLFTGYLEYFQVEHLSAVLHRPICLGHIDAYDQPVQIMGETSQSWIRTCFFFMSPETAYSVPGFVSFQDEHQFFDTNGNFLNSDDLSENYQRYIMDWLSGEAIQGVSWHSQITNRNSFMGKTLAILNEHMLSVQLRKAGNSLVDYYWLKAHIHELYSAIDCPIPDSIEQVKFRQAHLFGRPQGDLLPA